MLKQMQKEANQIRSHSKQDGADSNESDQEEKQGRKRTVAANVRQMDPGNCP